MKDSEMKKYVFSWINFHENQLTSEIIDTEYSMLEVVREFLNNDGWEVQDIQTIESLKEIAFSGDCMFEIIEIPND